ncbi:TPA: hypothetical protein DDW35_05090, partial [Candidatus Sumerlaeota bacterium]|nr:hypothetical protein [Candidatus Sumerlaeota bacterium]
NFRFETPRWHRLFLHTILLVALTSAITHVTLREELYPQQIRIGNGVEGKKGFESVLSTNPFPLSKKIAVTIVSWIAPASIKNPEKSWRGRMALALFQYLNINAPPLANTHIENLSRTPGNNRLSATLSMKVNKPSDTTTVLWSQVVEIDLDKHQLKSFDPELHGLTYALEIKRNTPSAHPSQNTLPGNVPLPAATDFPSGMVLDGIHIPDSWGRWPIHPKLGLWGLLQGEKDSPEKSFLVKKNANGDWSTVDSAILETSLSGRYSVSADGKWFMRTCRYYTSDSLTDTSVTVFATDHSTSWTISNPQSKLPMRQFLSWGYGSEEDFQRINHRGVYSFLPVSPSGRFLAFQRVQETTVASSGKLREFRDIIDGPELIESYLLDLQTGKEITLRQQKTSLSESRQKMLKKLMQTKAWEEWMQADKDTEGKCAREVRKTEEYESLLCTLGIGAFMPVWAPDQDRLALWNEEDRTKIYLFDVSADAVVDGPRVIDLGENSHLDDMGFWDSKTLLTLDGSRSSLSKIDIEKAAQR